MTIPLSVLVFLDKEAADLQILLSTASHVSLLPLLFRPEETLTKLLIVLFYLFIYLKWHDTHFAKVGRSLDSLSYFEKILLYGSALPVINEHVLYVLFPILKPFPFLPLMFYSVYCSLCISYCWLRLYTSFLADAKVKTR